MYWMNFEFMIPTVQFTLEIETASSLAILGI
jgi:hypothetical protein